MLGVIDVALEQRANQSRAFVGGAVVQERVAFFGSREQSDQIEGETALECGVVERLGPAAIAGFVLRYGL